jgi:hypothetical protein
VPVTPVFYTLSFVQGALTKRLPTSAWSIFLQAELAELEQRQQRQDGAQRSADGGAAAEAGDADAGRQEGAAAAAGADSSDSEPDQVHLPSVCLVLGLLLDNYRYLNAQLGYCCCCCCCCCLFTSWTTVI